ncbi:hypothetical protein [Ammoniphilus sp. 3BR4]|uniref:hypothetical protein n=1 Tax=Ammoniphilus sp. 3BR4 TaxID=3158265 RepID=UPI003465FE86
MLSLEEIKANILRLEPKEGIKLAIRAEIRALPNILLKGEELRVVTLGSYQETNGIMVATNHRIIFVDTRSWTPFPFAALFSITYKSSIEFQDGNRMGSILMDVSSNKIIINKVPATGANFVRLIQQQLDHYKPDDRFVNNGKKESSQATKSSKPVYLSVASIVLLSILCYWIFQGEARPAASSFGMTASEFSDQWNQSGKQNLPDPTIVENGKNKSFTHYFTDELKLVGFLAKDGNVQRVMMMGSDEEAVPKLIEQTISTVQPQLAEGEKADLVVKLGPMPDSDKVKQDRQIIHTGIRYSITHSEKIGIIFEAAVTGN